MIFCDRVDYDILGGFCDNCCMACNTCKTGYKENKNL
jgi:hypothetical protein